MSKSLIFAFIMCIFLAISVTAKPFIKAKDLTEEDFMDGTVMDAESNVNGVWFIKFYAPWWGHCKKLAPVWDELAQEVYTQTNLSDVGVDIQVGKIDCTTFRDVWDRVEVSGYPTLYVLDSSGAYQFQNRRTLENLLAFLSNQNYLTYGQKSKIERDADIPKSSLGKIYKEITKGLEFIFESLGLSFIPHFGQLAIAGFICSLPFLLIIYAICYPDEEYEKYKAMYEEQKKKEMEGKSNTKDEKEKKE